MEALTNMLQALVITLREGMEAALVVGIIFAYLQRAGRPELGRPVWIGIILAIAASVMGAVAFQVFGIDPENEIMEGTFMTAAALMVGTLVIWMWRQGKGAKAGIENRLDDLLSGDKGRGMFAGAGIGLMLFIFFMVLREGIETVLFLTALGETVAANPMYNLIGGALGLALAVTFGLLLYKGTLRINLGSFFRVTGLVLLVLVVKLLANGIHEFTEVGLLPTNELMMSVVGWLAKDSTSAFILMALIGLPALVVLKEGMKVKPELTDGQAASERRKSLARAQSARRWGVATGVTGLALVMALGATQAIAAAGRHDPEPVAMEQQASPQTIEIPFSELENAVINKFTYEVGGREVRFFIIGIDGEYKAAFDVCEVCPAKGFLQEHDTLICKNCNAPVNLDTLEMGGGCNPIPLPITVEEERVVIGMDDLTDPEGGFAKFDA